ncbi:iron-containing redox enzyme family protein [Pseudomonas batumici]|nr:iron-containing redox enzyme family protein [Pseudomonas batumici]
MAILDMPVRKAGFELLLKENKRFADSYRSSCLMSLIQSKQMENKENRERLLDAIQIFSDYFQKTIMLRSALCDDRKFLSVVQAHLNEEFGHNFKLMKDRKYRAPVWHPVLEATAAWFSWKMLTLDNDEKTVLIHLVLEASANIFFSAAHNVMRDYGETDYFEVHADADARHEQMGSELLDGLCAEKYVNLMTIQQQGWAMLNAACDQIAHLSTHS